MNENSLNLPWTNSQCIFCMKRLLQVSLISTILPPTVRKLITYDISVIILFNTDCSFAYDSKFLPLFLGEIFLFTIRHSRGRKSLRVTRQISTKVNKSPTLSKMSTKKSMCGSSGDIYTCRYAPHWLFRISGLNLETPLFVAVF